MSCLLTYFIGSKKGTGERRLRDAKEKEKEKEIEKEKKKEKLEGMKKREKEKDCVSRRTKDREKSNMPEEGRTSAETAQEVFVFFLCNAGVVTDALFYKKLLSCI
jgi:hypothetical protein